MIDVDYVTNIFLEARKSLSKKGEPKNLYISVPPDKLRECASDLHEEGVRWCASSLHPRQAVRRYEDDKNCGILVYSPAAFYFYETHRSGDPYDANKDKFLCVKYEDLINHNISKKLDMDKFFALLE